MPAPEEVLEWPLPRLAGYKLPRQLSIVTELPPDPTGKLELRRVRELLQAPEAPS